MLDIHQALQRILRFIDGMKREEFLRDEKTQSAVVREMILIGEAANRISQPSRETHASLPWKRMKQLRNFYVHGYRRLDFNEVWHSVTRFCSQLEKTIEPILPKEQGE